MGRLHASPLRPKRATSTCTSRCGDLDRIWVSQRKLPRTSGTPSALCTRRATTCRHATRVPQPPKRVNLTPKSASSTRRQKRFSQSGPTRCRRCQPRCRTATRSFSSTTRAKVRESVRSQVRSVHSKCNTGRWHRLTTLSSRHCLPRKTRQNGRTLKSAA